MNIQHTISLIKAKDKQAEKELFLRFAPLVLTICRRYASQQAEADDFMQECFILIYNNIGKYDCTKGVFPAWLNSVCTNRILQLLRKNKNEVSIVFPENLPDKEIVESEILEISEETLINAIQMLPIGYRKVLNLYTFDGWSHKEISKELNIAVATSRSQLSRARKMLRYILQKKTMNYERKLA